MPCLRRHKFPVIAYILAPWLPAALSAYHHADGAWLHWGCGRHASPFLPPLHASPAFPVVPASHGHHLYRHTGWEPETASYVDWSDFFPSAKSGAFSFKYDESHYSIPLPCQESAVLSILLKSIKCHLTLLCYLKMRIYMYEIFTWSFESAFLPCLIHIAKIPLLYVLGQSFIL